MSAPVPVPATGPSAVIEEITALGGFFAVDQWRATAVDAAGDADTEADAWQPMGPAELTARGVAGRERVGPAGKQAVPGDGGWGAASGAHPRPTLPLRSPAPAPATLPRPPPPLAPDE